MRKDIDTIMEEQNIDALWVCGDLFNNPDMVYFTGIRHTTNADLFKRIGKEPILLHFSTMEREEAAKSGLQTQAYFAEKPLVDYMKENNGDMGSAIAARMKEAMLAYGLSQGKVAISGHLNIGYKYGLIEKLKTIMPDLAITSFIKDSPFERTRMTKSADEAAHIRSMGKLTTEVIGRAQSFLQSCRVKDEMLLFENGSPVTVKDVKGKIQLWLAELGADNPEATIFSIGRDGGIPHNVGSPDDVLTLGKPIVFDIFPCEAGGGYFYDCTRTWCLGYASDEVQELYDAVLDVHHTVIDQLRPDTHFKDYQALTCRLFKEKGHITVAEDSTTQEGYLHSVGHGVGLNIHEKPFSGSTAAPDDKLLPGVVFTIEPGLYYPDKGMGVRIEDTIYLNENNEFEILADYPYDLVIPMS